MTTPLLTWRVVGWDARFETRGSLRQRGPRGKLTVTTNLEGDELGRLLAVSGGFMAFAVWNLVFRLAATCARRGVLVKDGLPMPVDHLAKLAQFPVNVIQRALDLLASPEIGLMEVVPLHEATVPAEPLEPLPRKPRIQPLLQCPVCNADLTEYYQLELEKGSDPDCAQHPQGHSGNRGQTPFPNPTGESTKVSSAEGQVPAREVTERARAEAAAGSRIGENSGAEPQGVRILTNSATVGGQTDDCGADSKPRPTWLKPATLSSTTREEIEEIHERFQRGEMTIAEVSHFIATHYYEEEDDEDEEDWDWDEEDWEEFLMDIPPPKSREWG